MNKVIPLLALLTVVTIFPLAASAQSDAIPSWIKNNAGWWADGVIDDGSFVSGIEWLVSNSIIEIPATVVSGTAESTIPGWVKNTAGWWADNQISDDDFVNAIQHLIKVGIMAVPQAEQTVPSTPTPEATPSSSDSALTAYYNKVKAELAKCQEYDKASDVFLCENEFKGKLETAEYMMKAKKYVVGPMHYYYVPAQVVITPDGNSNLFMSFVVHNTDSKNNSVYCTGPVACNYTITDGKKEWVYSTNTITTGRLEMKPDVIASIDFAFGPPAQRHLERWNYDPSSDYYLKITEPFGNFNIPLELTVK